MVKFNEKRWSVGLFFWLLLYVSSFWLWDRTGDFASWSEHLASDDWLLHRVLERKNVATIIQAVGAFVAFYGLLRAYVRAQFGLTGAGLALRIGAARQRAWARLVSRQRAVTGPPCVRGMFCLAEYLKIPWSVIGGLTGGAY